MSRVETILGYHSNENAHYIGDALRSSVTDMLSSSEEGRVYVYLEAADLLDRDAIVLESALSDGFLPSHAFYIPDFIRKNGVLPGSRQEIQEFILNSTKVLRPYRKELCTALDTLVEKYNQAGERIVTRYESHDQGELDSLKYLFSLEDSLWRRHYDLLSEGSISDALSLFKQCSMARIQSNQIRDASIVSAIHLLCRQDDIAGVVGIFGDEHMNIQHSLNRRGIQSLIRYLEYGGRVKHRYMPVTAIQRKVLFTGEESISEIDWYQAMIGQQMIEQTRREIHDFTQFNFQHILDDTYDDIALIQTMDDVHAFEKSIRQNGLEYALSHRFAGG